MELVDEIIRLGQNSPTPIADLLRKCLVLSYTLNNEVLRTWCENELNGYKGASDVPQYRKVTVVSRGNFVRDDGATMRDQPLQTSVLEKKHRALASEVPLLQPIASYANVESKPDALLALEWPPDMTVHYQSAFFPYHTLRKAWNVIPPSAVIGMLDAVRTRILLFALELRKELGEVGDNPSNLPVDQINKTVVANIFGGTNYFGPANQTVVQIGSITVNQNDLESLANALQTLGISATETKQLSEAIKADTDPDGKPTLGARTISWIKSIGTTVGKEGLKVSVEVAKTLATKWLMQSLGLPT